MLLSINVSLLTGYSDNLAPSGFIYFTAHRAISLANVCPISYSVDKSALLAAPLIVLKGYLDLRRWSFRFFYNIFIKILLSYSRLFI